MSPVRTVLSFENFDVFGGTETYVLTVAEQLAHVGHEAVVYTPNAGEIAEAARRRGVRVVGLGQLPTECDAVFAQDAATCYELARRFPRATRVFAVHSRDYVLQQIPQLPDVCDGAVVFNDRVRRWIESHAWHPPVTRLRQPVSLKRFFSLGDPRPSPSRVLVSSNYFAGARAQLIREACRGAGLEADWIGLTTRPTSTPEWAIADADIVIGQGRTIVEAMAAGRAAYVYGTVGGDGWVTGESYRQLEADGFAGLSNDSVVDGASLSADLRRWHAHMGHVNRDLACTHHDVRDHVIELIDLLRRLARASAPDQRQLDGTAQLDELARLVRLEWQARANAQAAAAEAGHLRAERDRQLRDARLAQQAVDEAGRAAAEAGRAAEEARRAADEARRAADEAERELRALRDTRRFRLACAFATPLDRIRAARGRRAS